MDKVEQLLINGLQELNLAVETDKVERLLAFMALIHKWNKAYNLTSVRNIEAMVSLHLLDSLAILPYLRGQRVLDIGTGAGLPGIPLAIYQPEMEFVLLDSNAKKTRFVQQAVLELKLPNVRIQHSRVESFKPELGFDTVVCRAFASLSEIIKLTIHLRAVNGLLLAMKGQAPTEELAQIPSSYKLIPIKVPQIAAERCLIVLENSHY